MKWFRFYDEVVDDPKVQKLPLPLFRAWVNLLCISNRSEPRGELPDTATIAFHLRLSEGKIAEILRALCLAGLIDRDRSRYTMHNWNGRQRLSDDVAKRVQKHREPVSGNVTDHVTRNVTNPFPHVRATETETETETDKELVPLPAREEGETEVETRQDRQTDVFVAFAAAAGLKPLTHEFRRQQTDGMTILAEADSTGTMPDPDTMRLMTGYVRANWRFGNITATPKLRKVLEAESEFAAWHRAWIEAGSPMAETLPDGTEIPDYLLLRRSGTQPRAPNGAGPRSIPLRDNTIKTDDFESF